MPLGKKWRSLDFFGSLENLHLPSYHHHRRDKDKHGKETSKKHPELDRKHSEGVDQFYEEPSRFPFRSRLSSLSSGSEHRGAGGTETRRDSDTSDGPTTWSATGLVQRCVIIQKDERGYGLTVSGDNPVYVASVKPEGAAAKAGVQKHDRIVKVNGTLVTSKNHTDVVRLIKSGAYVALTLMGKPNSARSPGGNQPPSSPSLPDPSNAPANRNSRITAPQPVAPDKDRELQLQKVHMTQAMFEQAKEDFQKHQRLYVKTPSEKLHTQLLEKERTVKTLENQLRQLLGSDEPSTPSATQGSQRFPDIDQISNTDSASLNSWATSLPVSDLGSMSDSPHTSPSISPTPVHPDNRTDDSNSLSSRTDSAIEDCGSMQSAQIITIDDEDVNSDDDQLLAVPAWPGNSPVNRPVSPFLSKLHTAEMVDTGPFSDIHLLERKPAHMAVFLHYLISNSDPSPFFFNIVTDAFKQTPGNNKDLRKWGYEIFSTFLAPSSPLRVAVSEALVTQVNDILAAGTTRADNEATLRSMFDGVRAALTPELSEQLADFRNKRDLGLGNIFGVHELKENMDKNSELKMIDKYLMPHLYYCTQEDSGRKLLDRDQAMGWALATFFRQVGITKTPSSGSILERVQSFIMKDKRGFKIPGSRSTKTKTVKGHQFNLQHFYVPTVCSKCEGLIWGVGYQGFLCQGCEAGVHKQCVEDVTETCSGKKRGKRASAFIPVLSTSRKTSNPNPQAGERSYSVSEALGQALAGESKSPPYTATEAPGIAVTQPLRKEEDSELAGLPTEHSVKSIVNRYHELTNPTGPGPGEENAPDSQSRKGSIDLSRSESLKGKGDKAERPARRSKSDVDRDDMFRALNQQSGSSSASSLSNRSMESPSASSEHVNEALSVAWADQYDSDLDVEELPSLKQVLGEDVMKKLKPKEKKRQEVINELFHTEKAHLRNLKVLHILFYSPMVNAGIMPELARALFPNIEEIIRLHASMNKVMKDRRSHNPVVGDVGDILLERFEGDKGDEFRKACAEYCRNQSFALEALKRHRRKDQRLAQFLTEAEADKLCRKLELKDHVPCQMQRLTKYPLLIENLLRHSQNNSQEYKNLERALERSKHILAYVNAAVRECENYHKLKEMQKKLDKRAIDASADPSLIDIKKLDLTVHKLVFDGSLVWRLRSHRQIELHVLLLEDILVLLQRVDERLVLKCQSTNQQAIGSDYKYTHSPVLKLQNLLARNVATDKKAFFVINTSDTGPQIYELVAQTQDARKMWCKLINEEAEKRKQSVGSSKISSLTKSTPSPDRAEMEQTRRQILRKSRDPSPPPPTPSDQDVPDGVFPSAIPDYQPELIQPDQVDVSEAVVVEAQPVVSPKGATTAKLPQLEELWAKGLLTHDTPVPMDQLRGMANEMNNILSNLVSAMDTKGEERKSLRTELQAAQDRLEMLKSIQRQMMSQQPSSPSTPQSRPQSFASIASSISEGGETTDSDRQDEETGLKVALTHEVTESTEETVQQLLTSVQPQVATTTSPSPTSHHPDDDSDDGSEMIPENLPLPDENSVRDSESLASMSQMVSQRRGSAVEPMTTELNEAGHREEEEGGRTTPTPSSMRMVREDEEREEDRDSITTLCDSQPVHGARTSSEEDSTQKCGEDNGVNNNNSSGSSNQDSTLTNPIHI